MYFNKNNFSPQYYDYNFLGFKVNVYIIVDLVKHGMLTLFIAQDTLL